MEVQEPQFLPTITTDGMVNIKIENSHGVNDHFLYVEELREILNESGKKYEFTGAKLF